jgi:hypothetical protein
MEPLRQRFHERSAAGSKLVLDYYPRQRLQAVRTISPPFRARPHRDYALDRQPDAPGGGFIGVLHGSAGADDELRVFHRLAGEGGMFLERPLNVPPDPEWRVSLWLWFIVRQLYRQNFAGLLLLPQPRTPFTHVSPDPFSASVTAIELARRSAEPPRPRLTVDLARRTLTLDGTTFDVTSENALRWVKVLADHPGEWIATKALRGYDPDLQVQRTDRIRGFLPDQVKGLIESQTGGGSRIRL